MALKNGFEPLTVALTGRCSTIELLENGCADGICTRDLRLMRPASCWLLYGAMMRRGRAARLFNTFSFLTVAFALPVVICQTRQERRAGHGPG